jgi:DNA-binding XRE family transcriptional regulator
MILSELKTNKNALSKELGYGNNVGLTNIENGKYNFSTQLASRIVAKFPQFSYKWVLKGEGEVLNNQNIGDVSNSTVIGANVHGNVTHNDFSEMIELQKGYQELLKKKDGHISELLLIINKLTNYGK